MKRAIAHHRATHAHKQRCETAAVVPPEKPKATNVVDHWGGAHPPSALQCGPTGWYLGSVNRCRDIK